MAGTVPKEVLNRARELRYNVLITNWTSDCVELSDIDALKVGTMEDGSITSVSKDVMLNGNIRISPYNTPDFKIVCSAREPMPGDKAFEAALELAVHLGEGGELLETPRPLVSIFFQEPMDPDSTTKPEVRFTMHYKGYRVAAPQQQLGWNKATDTVEITITE